MLSAIEGLEIRAPKMDPFIVPITVVILLALFLIQRAGTGRIGVSFGPIMFLWFLSIAIFGILQVSKELNYVTL